MSQQSLVILFFCIILAWEYYLPNDKDVVVDQRWLSNFSLTILTTLIVILLGDFIPSYSLNSEILTQVSRISVVDLSLYFLILLFVDFVFYLLHRVSHFVELLWKLHRVHHSDPYMDVSTHFRHHPLEYIWVFSLFSFLVWLLALPVVVVAFYFVLATLIQMWHHANIKVEQRVESIIGFIFITPSMHRVHHQQSWKESNSNFGAVFCFWDRIFKTFILENQNYNDFGIQGFTSKKQQSLTKLIKQPFIK